ncbi:PEP-CTERM sorting domain-containing protein [Derxia lacustris]|uniref:PEP-CTERM sorting domain-containing protein n=1 Tax=Derxia lacustris TaxID=764842 RepID=UPI000A177E7A|nr:PEP-CTERM sorting domain-containing protein [Derxia lacustris]
MKLKALLCSTLLSLGAIGAAHADVKSQDFYPQAYVAPTFTNYLVGTFTVDNALSDVVGSVTAFDTISVGPISFQLARVTFSGTEIVDTHATDSDPGVATFSYSGLGFGTYRILASGSWTSTFPQYPVTFLKGHIDMTDTVVPEPAPIALAGFGIASLWLRRRKATGK